jgi:hypothetical protein
MEKVDLITVEIETTLGAKYVFPDMERAALERMLPKMGEPKLVHEQLTIVNASIALLSLPFRIVKVVRVEGEEWWKRPD